jgi:PAS domain S-box-containing protein
MWSVLLVENDGSLRRAIKEDLAERGFGVTEAEDGLAALEAVRAATPHCLITDVILPKIDGYHLVQHLRRDDRYRHVLLVAMTAVLPGELAQPPEPLPVDAYVVKGPLAVLLENLRLALEGLQARKAGEAPEPIRFVPEGFVSRRVVGELIATKLHYQRLLEHVPQGIIETDQAGWILYANPAAIRLLERDELEVLGCRLGRILEPKNGQKIDWLLQSAPRESPAPLKPFLISARNKVLRVQIDCVREASGEMRFVIALEDLSFLKSLLHV